MKIIISESQYERLIMEHYDSERLYPREYIVNRLKKAPRELRKFVKDLPSIDCQDDLGNRTVCTKIPEVVYVYISGRY